MCKRPFKSWEIRLPRAEAIDMSTAKVQSDADAIIRAYDEALNELLDLQDDVTDAIAKVRRKLIEARRTALKKAEVGPSGT